MLLRLSKGRKLAAVIIAAARGPSRCVIGTGLGLVRTDPPLRAAVLRIGDLEKHAQMNVPARELAECERRLSPADQDGSCSDWNCSTSGHMSSPIST